MRAFLCRIKYKTDGFGISTQSFKGWEILLASLIPVAQRKHKEFFFFFEFWIRGVGWCKWAEQDAGERCGRGSMVIAMALNSCSHLKQIKWEMGLTWKQFCPHYYQLSPVAGVSLPWDNSMTKGSQKCSLAALSESRVWFHAYAFLLLVLPVIFEKLWIFNYLFIFCILSELYRDLDIIFYVFVNFNKTKFLPLEMYFFFLI